MVSLLFSVMIMMSNDKIRSDLSSETLFCDLQRQTFLWFPWSLVCKHSASPFILHNGKITTIDMIIEHIWCGCGCGCGDIIDKLK